MTDENGNDVTLYGWFDDEYAKEVWQLTCDYREENGLNRLEYNYECQEASNLRCLEAAIYWGHIRPDKTKWNTVTSNWKYGGENLAEGYKSPEGVMGGWKNSPGHNANLLRGIIEGATPFKAMSVGCFHRYVFDEKHPCIPDETITWSQHFTYYQY